MNFKHLLLSLTVALLCFVVKANNQDEEKLTFKTVDENGDSITIDLSSFLDSLANANDSINNSFTFIKAGETLELANGKVSLTVPKGYKFLDKEQSKTVIVDLWGNLEANNGLGMLFIDSTNVLGDMPYAIEISYDEIGYVEDDDADEIDYDDLLVEMQKDNKISNKKREELGLYTLNLIGWASAPYYDKDKHVLHWAKEFEVFYDDAKELTNTLNYDVRLLGRKGILSMNFIADVSSLELIKNDIPTINSSVNFNSGFSYGDFNPDFDDIAAVGIAGLIAGKVLSKGGFFVLLAKFWKVIAIGFISVFGFLFKRNKN